MLHYVFNVNLSIEQLDCLVIKIFLQHWNVLDVFVYQFNAQNM